MRPTIVTDKLPLEPPPEGYDVLVDGVLTRSPRLTDPREVLWRLRESKRELARRERDVESARRVQDRYIARARSMGYSDAVIAVQLGVTRQAVSQRPRSGS